MYINTLKVRFSTGFGGQIVIFSVNKLFLTALSKFWTIQINQKKKKGLVVSWME